MSGRLYPTCKPAWAQQAEDISSMLQMEGLLKILASSRASLTSLRLAADNIKPFDAASQVSLEGVWPGILRFNGLQSLPLAGKSITSNPSGACQLHLIAFGDRSVPLWDYMFCLQESDLALLWISLPFQGVLKPKKP